MHTYPRPPDPRHAALVSRLLRSSELKWRHHGIGLLQAYVVEGSHPSDTETRLHVWHPSLRLEGMDDSGLMHDHRFVLESSVLLGAMLDTEIRLHEEFHHEYDAREERPDIFQIWRIENARAKESSGQGWVKLESEARYSLERAKHVYSQGATYHYKARAFHRSDVDELTVTLCVKRNQSSEPARLLAKAGATPRHAFEDDPNRYHDADNPACRALLLEASDRLATLARNERRWS